MPEITWNADLYSIKHNFVFKYGEDVLEWLKPLPGENILDVGCGTGELTYELSKSEANVIGIDASEAMIKKAKTSFPFIDFLVKDATDFSFKQQFDAVFSNATLHWINNQKAAIQCIYQSLKKGGRFVFEMGGKHNIESIHSTLTSVMNEEGLQHFIPAYSNYFPSVAQQALLLEEAGLIISNILYFKRPTQLSGEDGMKNWIVQFCTFYLEKLSQQQKENVINKTVNALRPSNYIDGVWIADYVRLRCKAIKE